MSVLPRALNEVIDALGSLPGVGPRTAERYAYYLAKQDPSIAQKLARNLEGLHAGIGLCKKTFAIISSDQEYSELYTNPDRNKKLVAVVAEPFDIVALENTGQFKGTYHVLGGLVSPIDGIGPEQLHIPELLARIDEDGVEEIILATSANVEGESTALFLQKHIQDANIDVKMSRLARGIPVGVDLEYADQITLSHALEGRRAL